MAAVGPVELLIPLGMVLAVVLPVLRPVVAGAPPRRRPRT